MAITHAKDALNDPETRLSRFLDESSTIVKVVLKFRKIN